MDYYGLLWIIYYGLLWITMDYYGFILITMDYYGLFPPLLSTTAGFDHRAGRDRWDHHDDVRADRVLVPGTARSGPTRAGLVPGLVYYIYMIYVYLYMCIYVYLYICISVDMYICMSVYMYICRYVDMYICIQYMYLVN